MLGLIGDDEVWQLVLLWGVVVGIGTGLTALVLGATVATRWFSERRGLVMGMLTASTATGPAHLPAAAREADRAPTAGAPRSCFVVRDADASPRSLVLLLMRDRPSDIGLAALSARARSYRRPRIAAASATLLLSPLLRLARRRAVPRFLGAVRARSSSAGSAPTA